MYCRFFFFLLYSSLHGIDDETIIHVHDLPCNLFPAHVCITLCESCMILLYVRAFFSSYFYSLEKAIPACVTRIGMLYSSSAWWQQNALLSFSSIIIDIFFGVFSLLTLFWAGGSVVRQQQRHFFRGGAVHYFRALVLPHVVASSEGRSRSLARAVFTFLGHDVYERLAEGRRGREGDTAVWGGEGREDQWMDGWSWSESQHSTRRLRSPSCVRACVWVCFFVSLSRGCILPLFRFFSFFSRRKGAQRDKRTCRG